MGQRGEAPFQRPARLGRGPLCKRAPRRGRSKAQDRTGVGQCCRWSGLGLSVLMPLGMGRVSGDGNRVMTRSMARFRRPPMRQHPAKGDQHDQQ